MSHQIITVAKIFIVIVFVNTSNIYAQKQVTHKNENWTQVYVNIKLSSKWGIATDAGYRFKDLFESTTQTLVRIGMNYNFNKSVFLQTGVAYFSSYPAQNGTHHLRIPEIRPYQRLFINSQSGKFSISQRIRLEERFVRKNKVDTLLDSYRFNYRFGYQINIQFPFVGSKIEPKKLFGILYDELFINFGKQIVYNQFDQNRIYLGMGYQINKASFVTAGYQYIWQQQSSGNKFNEIDSFRCTYTLNIDARKKEDSN